MTREQNTENLLEAVAEVYKVTVKQIESKDRYVPIPEARAVFFYLSTRDLGLTHEEAAIAVNRKRCNATQQGNKIEYTSVIYPEQAYRIQSIRDILAPEAANPYFEMYANMGRHDI